MITEIEDGKVKFPQKSYTKEGKELIDLIDGFRIRYDGSKVYFPELKSELLDEIEAKFDCYVSGEEYDSHDASDFSYGDAYGNPIYVSVYTKSCPKSKGGVCWSSAPNVTRSRDALKKFRPLDEYKNPWQFQIKAMSGWAECSADGDGVYIRNLGTFPTEELAELKAIIEAIETTKHYDADLKENNPKLWKEINEKPLP